MFDWKKYACACLTVGKLNQILHNGFFDQFPVGEIRDREIRLTKVSLEEVYVAFPSLRDWCAYE